MSESRSRSIGRIFQRFGPYVKPHRKTLGLAGLCMLGGIAMQLLAPWPMKIVFDVILAPPEKIAPILERIPWLPNDMTLVLALTSLSILLMAALKGIFGYGEALLVSKAGQHVIAAIRQRLYAHVQRLSHSFYDENRIGDLLSRLTGDIRRMQEILVNAILFVANRSMMLIGMLVIVFWMDWQLSLVALAVVPFLVLSVARSSGEIKGAARRQRRIQSKISSAFTEKLSAISVVQAFAREAHEDEAFLRNNQDSVEAGIAISRRQEALTRVAQVILAVGACGVVWFGVLRVQAGYLTPGDLIVFAAYMKGLYQPIRRLVRLSASIARATVSGERVLAILDIEPTIRDAPDAIAAPPFRGAIEFQDVAFAYRTGTPVLGGVKLRIEPGERVALVGTSGSGKSTLASLLLRFYDPTMGSVQIDGLDIRKYTLTSLREQISVVLQDPMLFHGTIRDNIAYGKLDASEEEILAAANAANVHDFVDALPDGYETVVGERGSTLSGGQRQRIAIARAIIRDAPIMILDEPAANLDETSKAAVRDALERLTRNKTCLTITHDLTGSTVADRVYLLRDGTTAEVGRPHFAAGSAPDVTVVMPFGSEPAVEPPVLEASRK